MNISTFQNINMQDVMNMPTEDIKKLVRFGSNTLNRRINRLHQIGTESGKIADDAYKYIEQTGGLFTTVSDTPGQLEKNRNELIHELKREIDFSNMTTSTVTGARETQKQREEWVKDKYGDDWNSWTREEQKQKVADEWDDYHKFSERHPNIPSNVLVDIYSTTNATPFDIERLVNEWQEAEQNKWRQAYEQAEAETQYKPKWEFF